MISELIVASILHFSTTSTSGRISEARSGDDKTTDAVGLIPRNTDKKQCFIIIRKTTTYITHIHCMLLASSEFVINLFPLVLFKTHKHMIPIPKLIQFYYSFFY